MFATVSVAVPTPVMCELLMYLKRTGNVQQPGEAVAAAITQWLETMQAYPPQPAPGTPQRGYQWKSLFLPDGTRLRMQYQGDHEYAMVEGDRLIYQGRPVSPNQFANSFGGGVRNAWQELAIRLPGEKRWTNAAARRAELASPSAPAKLSAVEPPPAAPPRDIGREPGREPGWDLPERRKYRYRMEDVAF